MRLKGPTADTAAFAEFAHGFSISDIPKTYFRSFSPACAKLAEITPSDFTRLHELTHVWSAPEIAGVWIFDCTWDVEFDG